MNRDGSKDEEEEMNPTRRAIAKATQLKRPGREC